MDASNRITKLVNHLGEAKGINLASNPTSAEQSTVFGKPGTKSDDDVVIVSALRTAIGKAKKGSFKDMTPDDLLTAVFQGVLKDSKVDPKLVADIEVGNCQTPGSYSMPARTAMFRAGFPETSSVRSVNRQCSSGLQAVAAIASNIKSGFFDIGIGAGVESMTHGGNPGDPSSLPPMNMNEIFSNSLAKDCLTPMGITSETVAERYGVTREDQDKFAVASHEKAVKAQASGRFKNEIVPVKVVVEGENGKEVVVTVDKDDGPRAGTNLEGLLKLKPAFKKDGSTTAGNASQVSDGAAAVLMTTRRRAKELKLPVLGVFRGFKAVGVKPDEMGVGPAFAIPAVVDACGVKLSDVDVFEINEAFASQAIYCVRKLGIDEKKVNPNGGAIALGHPLGMTGARQVATLLHEMKKQKKEGKKANLGVVSMCIGTGMGAAGLFECE